VGSSVGESKEGDTMRKAFHYFVIAFLVILTLSQSVAASQIFDSKSEVSYFSENGVIYQVNKTNGEKIPIYIHGVNWFGFETSDHIVYGLDYRNWREILLDVKKLGFNAIRLPFCSETIHGARPNSYRINYDINPDLKNLTSLEVMEKIIVEAEKLDLYVLLDYHSIGCKEIEPLWHTKSYPEEKYISDWVFLAKKFRKYYNVIGADIKNEPHDEASWGTGNEKTDFRLFAERVGGEILKVAPQWLIFIEGTQYTHVPDIDDVIKKNRWWAFWGENLMGVRKYPVRLPKEKIVYSPHVYGPSVYMMNYFRSQNFPDNLPPIWETHFGYLRELNYTIVIGEWGGTYKGLDRSWQDEFSKWLIRKRIYNFFYWCLNPESRDTGGIFLNDWKTVNWEKMRMIYKLIKASNPKFEEPLYIILKSNATTKVLRRHEKARIYWYTNGDIVSSNFAKSKEGEIQVVLNNSITFYIVAKKGNETLQKNLSFHVINTTTSIRESKAVKELISSKILELLAVLIILGVIIVIFRRILKK